ncbi:MAG: hypothetical protein QNK37_28060 [Acidobacteriota bacterium]|nr:hypothetical protein [Acidobacteriota bacterium]
MPLLLWLCSVVCYGNWEVMEVVFDQVLHPSGVSIFGEHLYVMSNREGMIAQYRIDKNHDLHFKKIIASKGEGPGELINPARFALSRALLVATDDKGLSFFQNTERFVKRMRFFSRSLSLLVDHDTAYVLSLSPRMDIVLESFSKDAEFLSSDRLEMLPHIGEVKQSIDFTDLALLCEGTLYSGPTDLFFFSNYFGMVFPMKNGMVTQTIDLSSSFTPLGTRVQEHNKKNLKKGFELVDGGRDLYPLCLASAMVGDELLIPFSPARYQDLFEIEIAEGYINVFDVADFSLVKKLKIPSAHIGGYYSFTAKKTDTGDYLAFGTTFVDREIALVKLLFSDQQND